MSVRPETELSSAISVFTSVQGEVAVMSAYQEIRDAWAVACDELMIPTTFGETRVIALRPSPLDRDVLARCHG